MAACKKENEEQRKREREAKEKEIKEAEKRQKLVGEGFIIVNEEDWVEMG